MTKSIETLKAELKTLEEASPLRALVGFKGTLSGASNHDPEKAVATFAAFMEKSGRTGKDAYLAVRDEVRSALNHAERLQKARRRLERALVSAGEGPSRERASVYEARVYERWMITALIRIRRAGKAWSSQARAAAVSETESA